MRRESNGPVLSAIFVDYDNIYLSLKRKNDEAAKRFAKDAGLWLKAIETGELVTATNDLFEPAKRRIVMSRCYGNPVPRRNQADNSTDMSSFPFVRHHFLRGGFEIIDCPPLTAQLKNSSDIRMVMDVRDSLTHDTYFDEFVILSGDADFTPVLHRLRAHARRTVIFANDHTAAPYTAISDGEVRESDLLKLLLDGKITTTVGTAPAIAVSSASIDAIRDEIILDVVANVRATSSPLPLEVLADRAMRALGHDKTIGTNWAGAGNFRELLARALPEDVRMTAAAPYLVFDVRQVALDTASAPAATHARGELRRAEPLVAAATPTAPVYAERVIAQPALSPQPAYQPQREIAPPAPRAPTPYVAPTRGQSAISAAASDAGLLAPQAPVAAAKPLPAGLAHKAPAAEAQTAAGVIASRAPAPQSTPPQRPVQPQHDINTSEGATLLQQSIARIHDACQAPPLSPPEYRALFELMATEINEANLQGALTVDNITHRAQSLGLDVRRDDVRFVLEVVSEADPWFEQGASANLFAGRFRNFVVARCRSQGLNLTADELDLIDAWFAGLPEAPQSASRPTQGRMGSSAQGGQQASAPAARTAGAAQQPQHAPVQPARASERWWSMEDGRQPAIDPRSPQRPAAAQNPGEFQPGGDLASGDDFPRIIKNRLRG